MIVVINDIKYSLLGEQVPGLMMVLINISLVILGLTVSAPRLIRWIKTYIKI